MEKGQNQKNNFITMQIGSLDKKGVGEEGRREGGERTDGVHQHIGGHSKKRKNRVQ